MKLTRDNKSSCEREVMLARGQSLPLGSSLSRVHVNRPLKGDIELFNIFTILVSILIITNENKCSSGTGLLSWFLLNNLKDLPAYI